jgi:lipoate-protein ligase A
LDIGHSSFVTGHSSLETFTYPVIPTPSTVISVKAEIHTYIPSTIMIVLGRSSKPEKEIAIDACLEDGIPIYHRRGGGCSVVLDSGNIILDWKLPISKLPNIRKSFTKISDWLIKGLNCVGVEGVYRAEVSDLAIENRKIAGASMYVGLDFLFYSASLLFSPNIDLMERYLKHPPREPKYRAGRSHKDFVTAIREYSEIKDIEVFRKRLEVNLRYQSSTVDI